MIRSGGVTDIPRFLAGLEIKYLLSIQYFTHCNYGFSYIIAWVVSKPQNKFCVCSSRRLRIRHVAIWEVPFFE